MESNKIANTVVAGSAESDEIINRAQGATINGGGGDDILSNIRKNKVKLAGDDGDDVLENLKGKNVTLDGGASNDDIYSDGVNVTINGGNGNDAVYVEGSQVTINGGAGDDEITIDSLASNVQIQYKSGDGNDLIEGFNDTSTLKIGDGTGTYSTVASSIASDLILRVADAQITLKGAGTLEAID